jgi:hypothetical protein
MITVLLRSNTEPGLQADLLFLPAVALAHPNVIIQMSYEAYPDDLVGRFLTGVSAL